MRNIFWILGFVAIIAVIRVLLGNVVSQTVDVNNTAQLVQVEIAFLVSLGLLGGFAALAFINAFKQRSG